MNSIDFSKEIWKPILGLEEEYSLSNYGRVRANEKTDVSGKQRKAKILKPLITQGYKHYLLQGKGSTKKLCFSVKKELKNYFSEEEICELEN